MRILWLTNMIPSPVQKALGGSSGGGVWVDHVLTDLISRGEDTLLLLCRSNREGAGTLRENVSFRLVAEPDPEKYYPAMESQFETLVREFQPEVVHIWGTEFGHTLAMMRTLKKLGLEKIAVISIQGICAFMEQHYCEGFPENIVNRYSFRDFLRQKNLKQQAKILSRRGAWEREALGLAKQVIGRTSWDRACTNQLNPDLTYYFCNETMREPFYEGAWNYKTCEKHLIFAPNWTSPPKGFHYLLRALAIVKKQFPDARIVVPGRSFYPENLKARLRMTAHQQYLISLTNRLGLKDSVDFLGSLTAEEMKTALLRANVFTLASSVENSPNTVGESMLLGIPTVAADVGGVQQMLIHGREGFVYQSTAEYMLAHYIMEVFRMEENAKTMGQAAARHARITHDPKTNFERLLEIYRIVGENKE